MKSILFIKRNQQLINEENTRREFFRFMQNEGKRSFREVVDNSELGTLLNESVVNIIRDERSFLSGENFQKLFEFAALLNNKWQKDTLRVLIINPPGTYFDELVNAFNEWSSLTGIDFVMANGQADSDIRISFSPNDGHWSFVGREAEHPSLIGQPTVNFDPIDLATLTKENRMGIFLHELGHSIGLIHEHQKENSPIHWNKAQVYLDCKNWYGWDNAKVDHNIFNSHNLNKLFYSKEFDVDSIMIYAIPNGWSSNYQINVMNTKLSTLDKKFAKAFYS